MLSNFLFNHLKQLFKMDNTLMDRIIEMQKEIHELKEKRQNERNTQKYNELSELIRDKDYEMWDLKFKDLAIFNKKKKMLS